MAWSTEETRKQAAALRMKDVVTREAYSDEWTAQERRDLLKDVKARRFSGIYRYPDTMSRTYEALIGAMERNGLLELFEAMTYQQQGAMLVACKEGFEAGREWAKKHPNEE